jgi:hypothetical protein
VNNRFNLGIMATSRNESAHMAIKRHLRNRLSNLLELYHTLRAATAYQKSVYKQRLAKERFSSFSEKHRKVGVLREIEHKVGRKALAQVWFQYRLGHQAWKNNTQGIAFAECLGAFTAQWGLPCKHVFYHLLQGGNGKNEPQPFCDYPQALPFDTIHKHWWLCDDGGDGLTEEERARFSKTLLCPHVVDDFN